MLTNFAEEIEVVESDAIKNFQIELPKESASATRKARKFAENFLFDDLEIDNVIIVGTTKLQKEDKVDHLLIKDFGVGLTAGLDFSKLADENPEWIGEPICLATEEDLLFSKFFLDGEQNEETRNYRKNKKELDELEEEED